MSNKKNSRGNNDPAGGLGTDRLHYFESRCGALVQTIREFVEIESPSDNKLAADRMGALLAARFEGAGGRRRFIAPRILATTFKSIFPGTRKRNRSCCWGISTPSIRSGRLRTCPAAWSRTGCTALACSI